MQANPLLVTAVGLPRDVLEYLFLVSEQLRVSTPTVMVSLSVISRYLEKQSGQLGLQLVVLGGLMIGWKVMETNAREVGMLHKWSSNPVTPSPTEIDGHQLRFLPS